METKITILAIFFENPEKEFHIREVAKLLKINHTTVRQYLNNFVKEEFLSLRKDRIYLYYKSNQNKKFLNLKLYYNLEKIRKSEIVEQIEKNYDYPAVILFGSYSKATDDSKSDVDICIISDIKKDKDYHKFEKDLNRKVSIHLFTSKDWETMKVKNPELVNNICNGIVLSGKLEAI